MRAIDQTVFGGETGNCLPACIASILEIPLSDAPSFVGDWDGWLLRLSAWLRPRKLGVVCIKGPPPESVGDALCIVSGKSPRGDFLHSTVWRGKQLAHDPHPSRAGLDDVADTLLLVVLDPTESVRRTPPPGVLEPGEGAEDLR